MLKRAKLLVMVWGSVIVLGGAASAGAADWGGDCGRRIAHEQHEPDRPIERHGYDSRPAEHERRELDRLYAECRYRDRYR